MNQQQLSFRDRPLSDEMRAAERLRRIRVLQRAEQAGDERAREMARRWLVNDSKQQQVAVDRAMVQV